MGIKQGFETENGKGFETESRYTGAARKLIGRIVARLGELQENERKLTNDEKAEIEEKMSALADAQEAYPDQHIRADIVEARNMLKDLSQGKIPEKYRAQEDEGFRKAA